MPRAETGMMDVGWRIRSAREARSVGGRILEGLRGDCGTSDWGMWMVGE